MNVAPELSVVIPSYNTKALLSRCLMSLEHEMHRTSVPVEVIVSDNGSTDGTIDTLRRSYSWVHIIELKSNRGFAAAVNAGIGSATGRYVLLLNSDTEVLPGCFQALLSFMLQHSRAGIAGPRLLNSDGTLQPSGNRFPSLWSDLLRFCGVYGFLKINPYYDARRNYNEAARVDEVSGAAMLIRREVLNTIGLFDEGYFFYYEDIDYCRRASAAGWEIWYVPQAEIIHHWQASSKRRDVAPRIRWAARESALRYYRTYHGPFAMVALWCVFNILEFVHVLRRPSITLTACRDLIRPTARKS
jgi:N-acetylglucosaminyl-diphospho-decaprenol L-rhamnosyltransferase